MKRFKRVIVVLFVISLLISIFAVPVNASAMTYNAIYSLFNAFGFVSNNSDALCDSLSNIYGYLTDPTKKLFRDLDAQNISYFLPDNATIKDFLSAAEKAYGKNRSFWLRSTQTHNKTSVEDLTLDDVQGLAGTQIQMQEAPLTSAQLESIAQSTQYTKNILRNLYDQVVVFQYELSQTMAHIPESLTALRTQITNGFNDLKTTLQTFRTNFVQQIDDVQIVLSEFRATFNTKISNLHESLTTKLSDVQHVMSTFRTQFVTEINNVHTTLQAMRESLTIYLPQLDGVLDIKTSDLKTVLSTFRTQFVEKIGELKQTVHNGLQQVKLQIEELRLDLKQGLTLNSGLTFADPSLGTDDDDKDKVNIGGGLGWFGHSYDLFGEFGTGLLAAGLILKQFTDMNYFSSIITISLSIGLVGVFFGIMLDVSSRESSKNIANKIKSSNKEGFNAGFKAGVEKAGG